ncbi:MAG: hypothetical protein H6745_05225 [Deltaproteobacteria bacterium]|nr:hypothetical protein [Deltaproteobacteria bacterium]
MRAHADDVHRAVARVLVGSDPASWEDVAQDAMLRVLRALPRFTPGGPATLRTWILTIAVRVAIDALRRRDRYGARPPPSSRASPPPRAPRIPSASPATASSAPASPAPWRPSPTISASPSCSAPTTTRTTPTSPTPPAAPSPP